MKSFAEPDTHFKIITSDTPVSVDGFALGEPTGEIKCRECGATHKNIDDIPHAQDCRQRFVHSEWYADTMLNE